MNTRSVDSIAPTGTYPPDSALETVMMSGCRPQCSKQKNLPVRPRPVCTSSMHQQCLVLAGTAPGLPPSTRGWPCTRPCPGSARRRRRRRRRSAELARSAAMSPKGTGSHPGSSGPNPSRNSAPPLSEGAVLEPVKGVLGVEDPVGRLVAWRANLMADSMASAPELQKKTRLISGVRNGRPAASASRPGRRAQSIWTMLGRSTSMAWCRAGLDGRMAPAEGVDPEAGQEVEVPLDRRRRRGSSPRPGRRSGRTRSS